MNIVAPPASTYRLQLHAGFTLAEATAQLGYLAELGVSHIFCSPILQAVPGSMHGYDVVDHTRVSDDLGGTDAYREFADAAHAQGLGLIVDVVPNHMAVPTPLYLNQPLWDVLRHGPESEFRAWFDVDLSRRKGILMPVLGNKIGAEIAADSIRVEQREIPGHGEQPVLTYYDHIFPIKPGTEDLPLLELLDQQWFRLAHWKVASEELNYRRFFDVDTLAAVRIEDQSVFEATHALLKQLADEDRIDGFRIDHIDGLTNPRHYFEQLQAFMGGTWVVAEKILEVDETLPTSFHLAGTTGYDALLHVGGLFHQPANLPRLDEIWERVSGSGEGFPTMLHDAKNVVIQDMLFTEVNRLTALVVDICSRDVRLGDHTRRGIMRAIEALLRSMDRYRAYLEPGHDAPESELRVIEEAAARARDLLEPDELETLDLVVALVCGEPGTGDAGGPADLPYVNSPKVTRELPDEQLTAADVRAEFMVRFAQTCGPVMAKSKEDTVFYRYNRFIALNEVGCEPTVVGIEPDRFHRFAAHQQHTWPDTMTTMSTHDTKRSEDVRARIAAQLAHAAEWEDALIAVRSATADARTDLLDGATEMLLWQTLAATWQLPGTLAGTAPISEQRLAAYLTKAMREAKHRTTWTAPDTGYEQAVLDFARHVLRSPEVREVLDEFTEATLPSVRAFILGQKLIQLTMPGVPDVYQGTEIVDLSLVDPDNRRPVDFGHRSALLPGIGSRTAATLDTEKLRVTATALRVRRAHPDAFRGARASYQPIASTTGRVLAFARSDGDYTAITVATRQIDAADTTQQLILPDQPWLDALTGKQWQGGPVGLTPLLEDLPVAFLVSEW